MSIGAKVAVWTVTHGHAAHLEHGVGLEDLILDGLHALRLARHRGDVAHDELRRLGLARSGLAHNSDSLSTDLLVSRNRPFYLPSSR